jgi:hypothetical protein
MRKLLVLITLGGLVAFLVKKLRGTPAPQFANHPTVRGGPLPDLVPAPQDPTVPAPADTTLVAAPHDPTVPARGDAAAPAAQPELDLEPLVPAPGDPTVPAPADTTLVPAPHDPTVPAGERTWVDPIDGACPDGYPIKAKVKSGIFHQPGGLAYDRTKPDRCYPDAATAEADGFRAPKR